MESSNWETDTRITKEEYEERGKVCVNNIEIEDRQREARERDEDEEKRDREVGITRVHRL